VARLGGDEFVVLLDGVTGTEDAERVAAEVLEAVRAPYRRDGHDVLVTASAGVSVYPTDGTSAEELLRSADAAMYREKDRGRWPAERLGGGRRRGRPKAPLPMVPRD
jgi:diguanylate cyclase (GGDEF)-like protein